MRRFQLAESSRGVPFWACEQLRGVEPPSARAIQQIGIQNKSAPELLTRITQESLVREYRTLDLIVFESTNATFLRKKAERVPAL